MPKRREHDGACPFVGAAAASLLSASEGDVLAEIVLKTAGGYLGGKIGGRMPDWVDPPTSPDHRSIGHGVVPVASMASQIVPVAIDGSRALTAFAREQLAQFEAAETDLGAIGYLLLYAGSLVLAGALVGLPAGYATHLVQDSVTKKSDLLLKNWSRVR